MNVNNGVITKKYHVSEYLITYQDESNNLHRIRVPNKFRMVLDGHQIRRLALKHISSKSPIHNPKIKKIEKYGDCAFCGHHRKLERSHVIGDTVFRRILKKSDSGTAIKISLSSPKKVQRDNKSWAIEMLCSECESMFNNNFEDYAINVLRGKNKEVKVTEMNHGISFNNIDQYRIILYVLSIYWRGAYSIDTAYNNFIITNGVSSYLKECFKGEQKLLKKAYSIKISKLYDKLELINSNGIKDLIINPFVEKTPNRVSYSVIFEGFLFEIYLLSLPFKERQKQGYLDPDKKILFSPLKDIFSIEAVTKSLAEAVIYSHNNLSDTEELSD